VKLSRLTWFLVTLAGTATLAVCGCAVSEALDPIDPSATGAGGDPGNPGVGGLNAGAAGGDPASGIGGTVGAAGAQGTGVGGTTGAAGAAGVAGATGTGGDMGLGGRGAAGGGSGGRGGRGGPGGAGGASGGGVSPDGGAAPAFAEIYQNILVTYCSGGSCHSPGSAGGVGFSTQASAYTALSRRVTPGDGAGSSFYNTVNSGAMPRGRAKLSAANLALIKAWIDGGALND
jgi:hypothetical protein